MISTKASIPPLVTVPAGFNLPGVYGYGRNLSSIIWVLNVHTVGAVLQGHNYLRRKKKHSLFDTWSEQAVKLWDYIEKSHQAGLTIILSGIVRDDLLTSHSYAVSKWHWRRLMSINTGAARLTNTIVVITRWWSVTNRVIILLGSDQLKVFVDTCFRYLVEGCK